MLGMSIVATSLPSSVSVLQVKSTDSSAEVGNAASSLSIVTRFYCHQLRFFLWDFCLFSLLEIGQTLILIKRRFCYNCQELHYYCYNNILINKLLALDIIFSIYKWFSQHCFTCSHNNSQKKINAIFFISNSLKISNSLSRVRLKSIQLSHQKNLFFRLFCLLSPPL